MDTKSLLREAIAAFKAGQRQYARELFLELVELEPANELAWLWLSGLLESRDEQIKALENSIAIASGGRNIEGRLQLVGQLDEGPELTKFRDALKAIEVGDRHQGRALLEQILADNKDHERAWMSLSEIAHDHEEKVNALENVLRINPNNFKARERLTNSQHLLYQDFLRLGREYQRRGELSKAVKAYQSAERYASTGSFRAAAQQRWQMIQFQSQFRGEQSSHPNITVFRLAVGPPLIFVLLVIIQSGLDLSQSFPLLIFGGMAVTLGSLLRVASTHTPLHPIWIAIWGERGLSDRRVQSFLQYLGFVILLAPFVYWLITAIIRFNETGSLF